MEPFYALFAANGIFALIGFAIFVGIILYGIHSGRNGLPAVEIPDDPALKSLKTMAHVSYGCLAVSIFFPIVGFVSPILDLVNRGKGTPFFESHVRWRLRTFVYAFVSGIVGFFLIFVYGLGWLVIIGASLWYVFRIVKGWVAFLERRPVYPIE